MLLGVQSRKTGLNVKHDIKKDEYSMENIDEFFKDDETSLIVTRNKNRKSSLLSAWSKNEISSDTGYQYSEEKVQDEPFTSSRRATEQFETRHPNSAQEGLARIEEDVLPLEDNGKYEIMDRIRASHLKTPAYDYDYDRDVTSDRGSIRLTPEKTSSKELYNDIPDLVDDDEDTKDFASLNTSENALLEDELDDDYVAESEEDRDYIEGESLLNNEEESYEEDDDDVQDFDGDDESDDYKKTSKSSLGLSYHNYGDHKISEEVYDSDEEYIQKQASELVNEDDFHGIEGLRRSRRVKIAPLEYWRNERVVYKRKSNKPVLDIDRIVTYDHKDDEEEEEEELGRAKKTKKRSVRTRPYTYVPTGKPRGRPRKKKSSEMNAYDPNIELLDDINSGNIETAAWLKHGILETNVNVSEDQVSNEIVAFAPNLAQSEQIKETEDESFSLEIMFDKHKEHFASGVLKLPLGGKKKISDSNRTFLTFYIIEGIVEVTLGENVFLSTKGSSIQIPAFNDYSFSNKGKNEVKMFFVQVTLNNDHYATSSNEEDAIKEISISHRDKLVQRDDFTSANESSPSSMSISEI